MTAEDISLLTDAIDELIDAKIANAASTDFVSVNDAKAALKMALALVFGDQ